MKKFNILYEIPAVDNVVDSYWFGEYKSGIKHLLVNTQTRWQGYQFHETFSKNDMYEYVLDLYEDEYQLTFPEELAKMFPQGKHLQVDSQEKDQISIYWIPFKLMQ